MTEAQIIAAFRQAALGIEDACLAVAPEGAPSGPMFAALQAHGMRLPTYQALIASMIKAGRITATRDNTIHLTPTRAAQLARTPKEPTP